MRSTRAPGRVGARSMRQVDLDGCRRQRRRSDSHDRGRGTGRLADGRAAPRGRDTRRCGRAAGGDHRSLASHAGSCHTISSGAKTGPSRQTRWGPSTPMTTQPRQAPTAQPIVCSIDTWSHDARRACGEPSGAVLPPPLRAQPRYAQAAVAPLGQPGQRGEHRLRAARERLVGPRLVAGHEVRHPAVMAEAAVIGRHDGTRPRRAAWSRDRPRPRSRLRTGPPPVDRSRWHRLPAPARLPCPDRPR